MSALKRACCYYAVERIMSNADFAELDILVSAADVPGEGEIKIVDRIEELALSNPGDSFLIVGQDSDLFLMGLAL